MVYLIVGPFGSGKLTRANELMRKRERPSLIFNLYDVTGPELLCNLIESRVRDVYILTYSGFDLSPFLFSIYVDEFHFYENGQWKVEKIDRFEKLRKDDINENT